MRQLTLSLLALFFIGCNSSNQITEEDDMAITAKTVPVELVSTNVTDSTDVFNNTVRQNYPYGTKYKQDYSIYMNTGDDINVTAYDSGATYTIGQIVYKDSLIKKCTGVMGEFVKQPEQYTAVDTSFDNSMWTERYMRVATVPAGVPLLGENFSTLSETQGASGLFISPDGTKMYILGTSYYAFQYTITNGDISTAVYSGNKKALPNDTQKTIWFSPDGLKMFTGGNLGVVSQFNLSTAWDLSTATFSLNVTLANSLIQGISFSTDGTKLFISNDYDNYEKVNRFILTTAWDLSTLNTTPDKTIDITTTIPTRRICGITFSPDGTKMYIAFYYSSAAPGAYARIEQHTLSSAWDITTHTKADEYTLNNYIAYDIRLSNDGKKLYEVGTITDKVFQHTLTTPYDLSTAIYSFIPYNHSEVRGEVTYEHGITYSGGTYTFTSSVNGTDSSYSPMTVYTELDYSSVEDKAYIGANGTWLAKTLIIRDDGLYVRTSLDEAIEYITLTDYQFSTVAKPSDMEGFGYISATNDYKPFDKYGTTQATSSSPMTYSTSTAESFNSFSLVNVVATSLTYTIKDTTDTVIKTATVAIDCTVDDNGLLPQVGVTLLIDAGQTVAGGTIDIELTNSLGDVKLGGLNANISIDEGLTLFDISTGARDYNDYTPDAWGNIPEGVKAKTKTFTINVKVPYTKFDKTYRRHLSYLGNFITIDGTDASLAPNASTLYSLVAKGLITSISHKTEVKNDRLDKYYSYNLTFLEIT